MGGYLLLIPATAAALIVPVTSRPRRNGGRPLSGAMCDLWTILSSILAMIVWATCDLHFDGMIVGDGDTISDDGGEECTPPPYEHATCTLSSSTNHDQHTHDHGGHPSVEQVSDAITQHCSMASLILGTAMVLELLQVVAHRTAARRIDRDGEEKDDDRTNGSENRDKKQEQTLYTLFGWLDSECLLFVYAQLFVTHLFMSADPSGESFGLIFAEPMAAAAGYYRPISTARYIEWSMASPLLMSLVGRSMPRIGKTNINCGISETLRPALVVTVSYIFLAWLALPVIDPFWRWALIFFSFMGYVFSVLDQLTSWKVDADVGAPCALASDALLKVQILVYGAYGAVFLLGLFDVLDPVVEQAVLSYVDATIKLVCSASLAAMRHADLLAEARRERIKADSIASDLRQIIHDANAPIFAVDADGVITLWNQKLCKITGAAVPDVIGKPLEDYLSRECRAEFQEVFEARRNGKVGTEQYHCDMISQHEFRGRNERDGEERIVSLLMTATARHDAEGNFVGVVGVGSDLTEVTRIKAIEEKKNQFMAVVSHELKSPLHGIIGLAESLAQSEKSSDERRGQLQMVKSCAVRLLDLVSNIMQISRLTRDRQREDDMSVTSSSGSNGGAETYGTYSKQKIRKDPVDIPSVVNEVCMLVTNATDKGNRPLLNPLVQFLNKLGSSGSRGASRLPIVEGDAYKITQVIFNIVTNACKFCQHGSITIDATLNKRMDRLEVSVEDTGVGINPENVKRVFEPFEQESNTSKRSFGGIGLGLAISKQVVELHGGDVFVQSTPGKGSRFVVSLPVTEEAVAQAATQSTSIVPPPFDVLQTQSNHAPNEYFNEFSESLVLRTGSQDSLKSLQRKVSSSMRPASYARRNSGRDSYEKNSGDEKTVVLSVDDDIVNQEVIRSALSSDHYEIHMAMNGFEALEFFSTRSQLPDLVLLDVMMPGMDGFEVLKVIREEKKISPTTLPVIMLSAMEPIDKAVIQSLKSGANDYVNKPFDPDILKARVSTAVEIKRLRQIENESFHHSRLLHDILPIHIVDAIIMGDKHISERHDSVCMLFSDIVGWTPMSETVPTHQLIEMLNQLFSEFDTLTEKHGVFKADTIGDAYIVAAGHEGQAGPHDATLRVVEFAIDMLEIVKMIMPPNGMQLQMRVGIHTGPAYSGVVGTKVPKYTFFGDTVNTAARMEKTGLPGCINMSSTACHALASDVAACRSGQSLHDWMAVNGSSIVKRDPIEVKGKGVMELSILCPRGVSPTLSRHFLSTMHASSKRPSMGSSIKSMSSSEERDLLARETVNLKDEVSILKDDLNRLEASKREAIAEVEALRLNLAERSTTMPEQMRRISYVPKFKGSSNHDTLSCQNALNSPSPFLVMRERADHQQTEELKLQLLVTTKSLVRARQALADKDDEIDEKEFQLQRANAQLQELTRGKLHRSVGLSDSISTCTIGTNARPGTFMARTQVLLEPSSLGRMALSSSETLGISEIGLSEREDTHNADFD